jgi:long-chain fatty acid transport protein
MKKNKLRFCLLLTALGVNTLATPEAIAAGYGIRLSSAIQTGAANSYGAALDGIEGIIDNPATAAYQLANAVIVNLTPVVPSVKFRPDVRTTRPISRDGAAQAVVPSFSAVYKVSNSLNLLFTADSPFGLKTDWLSPDWPTSQPNNAGWDGQNFNLLSDMVTHRFSAGGSLKVNEYLAIGATAQYMYTNAELTRTFSRREATAAVTQGLMTAHFPANTAQALAAGITPGFFPNDVKIRLKGHDWSWGATFGFVLKPWCGTRFGFSFTTIQHPNVRGNTSTNASAAVMNAIGNPTAALQAMAPGLVGANAANQAAFVLGAGEALERVAEGLSTLVQTKVKHPESYTFSFGQDINQMFTVMATAQFTRWNRFYQLNVYSRTSGHEVTSVTFNFRNTWFGSVGAEIRPCDNWKMRLGCAFDTPAVRKSMWRQPGIPDAGRFWVSGGFTYTPSKCWALSLGYTHEFVQKSRSDLVDPAKGSLNGHYKQHVDFVGLQAKYTF